MSGGTFGTNWLDLSSSGSNLFTRTYVQGFVDISGGNVILRNNNLYLTGGDTSLNGRLFVGGDASLNSRLYVGSDASFGGRIYAVGDVSFNSRLYLNSNSLFVNGVVFQGGSSYFAGDASVNLRLNVGSDVSMGGRLFAMGDASLNSRLYLGSDASFGGKLYVAGNTTVNSINTSGVITFNSTLATTITPDASQSIIPAAVSGLPAPYSQSWTLAGTTWTVTSSVVNGITLGQPATPGGSNYIYAYYPAAAFVTYATNVSQVSGGVRSWGYMGYHSGALTNGYFPFNGAVNAYTTTSGVSGGIGTLYGNWIQIQSSTAISITSFAMAPERQMGSTHSMEGPGAFYILGTNDNAFSSWDPILYGLFPANTQVNNNTTNAYYTLFTSAVSTTSKVTEIFPIPSGTASSVVNGQLTYTTYGNATKTYTYFRLVVVGGQRATGAFFNLYYTFATSSPSNAQILLNSTSADVVDVSGKLQVTNGLNVINSDASFGGRIFAVGDVSLNSRLYVGWDVSLGDNLFVVGDVSLNSRLYVGSDVSMGGRLFTVGDTSHNARLFVGSDVSLGGRLFVVNDASLNGNVSLAKDLTIGGNLYVKAYTTYQTITTLSYQLIVAEDISSSGRLFLAGDGSFNNRLYVASDVSMGGRLFTVGDTSLNRRLYVGSDVSLGGRLFAIGDVSLNSRLNVGSDASFGGRIFAIGDVSLNSRLNVGSDASFGGRLYLNSNSLFVNGVVFTGGSNNFTADVSMNSRLYVGSDVSMGGNLNVAKVLKATSISEAFVTNATTASSYTFDYSTGSVFYITSPPTTNFTCNFTNVPADINRNYVITVIINSSTNKVFCNSVQINTNTAFAPSFANGTPASVTFGSLITQSFAIQRVTAGDLAANINLFSSITPYSTTTAGYTVLTSAADASLNFRLLVGSDASFGGRLFAAGDVSLNSRLYVGGDVSFGGRIFAMGDVSLNNRLYVAWDVSLGDNLFVTGDVSLNNRLFVGLDVSLGGRLFARGDVSLNSRLSVGSDASFGGRLYLNSNSLFVNGVLFTGGSNNFTADVSMNSRLYVGSDVSMNANAYIAKKLTIGVSGGYSPFNLDVSGQLNFPGQVQGGIFYPDGTLQLGASPPYDFSNNFCTNVSTPPISPAAPSSNFFTSAMSQNGQFQIATTLTGGIYSSINSGASWYLNPSAPTTGWGTCVMSANGQYQYALGTGSNFIYSSSNYGATWAQLATPPIAGAQFYGSIAVSATGQYLAVAYGTSSSLLQDSGYLGTTSVNSPTMYFSQNYGATWTLVIPPSAVSSIFSMAMSANGQYVYVSAPSGFCSRNFGATWVSCSALAHSVQVSCSSNGQYVYMGNGNGLSYSSDFGISFTGAGIGCKYILISATGQYVISNYNSGFFYVSRNYGVTWKNLGYAYSYPGSMSADGNLITCFSGTTIYTFTVPVASNLSITGPLNSFGDVSLNQRLYVGSDVSFGGRIFAMGDVSMNKRLYVGSDVSLGGRLFSTGDVSLNSRLYVGSDVSLGGRLFVVSDASINGNVSLAKDLTIGGNLYVKAYTTYQTITTLSYQLIVAEDISSSGRLFLAGDGSFNNRLYVASDVSMGGRLFTVGDVSLNSRLYVGGDVSFGGRIFAMGDVSLNNRLYVAWDVSLGDNLFVTGDVSLNNRLFVGLDVSLGGRLFAKGDVSMNSRLYVGSDLSVNGNVGLNKSSTLWVASGQGGNTIATSTDAINWTGRGTSAFSSLSFGAVWNGSIWVAVGSGGNTIATSTDGINWTGRGSTVLTGQGSDVAWNGALWVAVGNAGNTIATSTDGINWTGRGSSVFTNLGTSVAWTGSLWVAGGNGGFGSSPDGTNWTARGSIISGYVESIATSGSLSVAVGSGGNTIATSTDGLTWTGRGSNVFTSNGYSVAWNGSLWVAGGTGGNTIATSTDGINWTGRGTAVFSTHMYGIAWNGSLWVGAGSGGNTIATSTDGINWTGRGGTNIFTTQGLGVGYSLSTPSVNFTLGNNNLLNITGGLNIVTPNTSSTSTPSWTYNGINWSWTASSASFNELTFCAPFNDKIANVGGNYYDSGAFYNSSGLPTGAYATTTVNSIGTVNGEYIQLRSSVPLVMTSYQIANGDVLMRAAKTFYIVGSNDGTTWYPIQYFSVPANPYTDRFQYLTNNPTVIVNNQYTASSYGATTLTTTTYGDNTTNSYTYFRMIMTSIFSTDTYFSIAEWKIQFSAPSTASLSVTGDISLNSRLFVGSDASMGGRLFVIGDTSFNNRLYVGSSLSTGGRLFVGNDVSINGNLYLPYLNSYPLLGAALVTASSFGQTWTSYASRNTGNYIGPAISSTGQYQFVSNLYSSNYGQTWATATVNSGPASLGCTAISADGKYLIGITNEGGGNVYYSSDFGQTWNASNLNISYYGPGGLGMSATGQYCVIGKYTHSPVVVYYSTNYGQTWTATATSPSTNGGFKPAAISGDGTRLLVGNSAYGGLSAASGIWYSSNAGTTWTQANLSNVVMIDIKMSYTGQYCIASKDNGIYYSSDYGVTWTLSTSSPTNSALALDSTGRYGLATSGFDGTAPGVYYTTNYGQTWTLSNQTTGNFHVALSSGGIYGMAVSKNSNIGIYQQINPSSIPTLGGIVNVSGDLMANDISANTRLFVGGDVSMNGRLFTIGDTSLNSRLYVGSDVSLGGRLFARGDVSLNSRLSVGSDASFGGRLYLNSNSLFINGVLFTGGSNNFTADVSMNSRLYVGSDVSLGGRLFAAGDVSFNSRLFVGSDVSLGGRLFAVGDVSLNSRLYIGSDVSFGGRLFLVNDASMNGNVSLAKDLTIGGNLYVKTYTTRQTITELSYQLIVAQDLSLSGRLFSAGNLVSIAGTASTSTSTGALQITGGAGITGNIFAGGNVVANNLPKFWNSSRVNGIGGVATTGPYYYLIGTLGDYTIGSNAGSICITGTLGQWVLPNRATVDIAITSRGGSTTSANVLGTINSATTLANILTNVDFAIYYQGGSGSTAGPQYYVYLVTQATNFVWFDLTVTGNSLANTSDITLYDPAVGSLTTPSGTKLTTPSSVLSALQTYIIGGSLGIGQSVPAYNLDVTGNIRATSTIFSSNNQVATLIGTETLTNKTLTTPTITSPAITGTATITQPGLSTSALALYNATNAVNTVNMYPYLNVGSFNSITATNDSGLFWGNGINSVTGGFVIAPWATGPTGLRIGNTGNVSINTSTNTSALNVGGTATVTTSVSTPIVNATSLELGAYATSAEPYIDFKNNTAYDFNARIQLTGGSSNAISGTLRYIAGLHSFTDGNLTVGVNNASTSTTTGSLQVTGGAGITGNIFAGGALNAGAGTLTSLNVNGDSTFSGKAFVNDATSASGSRPNKGFYVWTDAAFGMELQNQNSTWNTSFITRNSDGGFAFKRVDGTQLMYINNSGNTSIYSTAASTTSTSGALTVGGGVGIAGNVFVGGNVSVASSFRPTIITEPFATNTGTTSPYTFDYSTGPTFYVTTPPASNFTCNFTNVPADINRTYVATIIIKTSSNRTFCNTVQINSNGTTFTPYFANGIPTSIATASVITQTISIQRLVASDAGPNGTNSHVLSAVIAYY